jgi:cell division inhibitor SepF
LAFWDSILNWLGYGSDDETPQVSERARGPEARPPGRGKLVSLPTTPNTTRLIISCPQSFDEISGLAENLKSFRPLIVNLQDLPVDEARRVVDFLSGATFALGGRVRRVSSGIFLFATSNIDLNVEAEKHIYSGMDWLQAAGRN